MAKKKTKKKAKKGNGRAPMKDGRLNLLINPSLKRRIKAYAQRKHTNVTQIVIDHFVKLLESEGDPDARSI